MCLPATILPTTRNSKDGYGLSFSASDGPPWTMSAHVIVLAGICTIMLQGTTIVMLLIVTVPPRRLACVTSGQSLLSALTVASWMKPVSSKPWMSAGAVVNAGSVRVGVTNGATAPAGGLAVPPPPFAYATTAPPISRAMPSSAARPSCPHPLRLRVPRSIGLVPPLGRFGLKTFVGVGGGRKAASRNAECGAEQRTPASGGGDGPGRAPDGRARPGAQRRSTRPRSPRRSARRAGGVRIQADAVPARMAVG